MAVPYYISAIPYSCAFAFAYCNTMKHFDGNMRRSILGDTIRSIVAHLPSNITHTCKPCIKYFIATLFSTSSFYNLQFTMGRKQPRVEDKAAIQGHSHPARNKHLGLQQIQLLQTHQDQSSLATTSCVDRHTPMSMLE